MREPNRFQDADYLRSEQYRDASNLDARAELHRRFSRNPNNWQPWVFAHLDLHPESQVLECGCGPGWLWRENLQRIPPDCQIVLTDLSPGMIAEAQAVLLSSGVNFRFQTADIEELPFGDGCFNVVVANHMLYHIENRTRALAEVVRVLQPHGRFVAATNGEHHMQELRQLWQTLLPELAELNLSMSLPFTLENGRSQLEPFFSKVQLVLYEDSLAVTEVAPLLAYLRSTTEARALLTGDRLQQAEEHVQQVIANQGAFHITKATGLFIAFPES